MLDVKDFPNPWLHVGSGPHRTEGWINLDLNNHPSFDVVNGGKGQPDILGSVFDIPFEDNTMDKCYVGHLLEHLKFELAPEAVKEMRRVLKPTGTICIVGPCMDKAIATNQPQWLLDEIPVGWNAENDPEGFPHLWTATTDLTRQVLELGGLSGIIEVGIETIHLPEWCNTATSDPRGGAGMWQCAFLANK